MSALATHLRALAHLRRAIEATPGGRWVPGAFDIPGIVWAEPEPGRMFKLRLSRKTAAIPANGQPANRV